MRELFQSSYYWLDLLVGYAAPLIAFGLYRTGRISRFVWRLFWVGCALGLTWEIPMFVLSAADTGLPLLVWVRPLPAHYLVFMLSHTLWDGGLFLIGVWLVHRLCPAPTFRVFRWQELAVLLIYGQVSELLVELSSTYNHGWAFIDDYPWNPTLFRFNGLPITLLPQLVWLIAPIAFYLIALRLNGQPVQAHPDGETALDGECP